MPRPSAAEKAKAITVGELATRAHYEVLRAGRETIQQSAPRWRRVTDGKPCEFCAMLAGRGPVYTSEDAADGGQYHAHCGCTAEPFDGDPSEWVPSPDEQLKEHTPTAVRREVSQWTRLDQRGIAALSDGTPLGDKVAAKIKQAFVLSDQTTVTIEASLTNDATEALLADIRDVLARTGDQFEGRFVTFHVPARDPIFRASSRGVTGGYVVGDTRVVTLNPRVVGVLDPPQNIDWSQFMAAAQDVGLRKWVITHELGHVLDSIHTHTRPVTRDHFRLIKDKVSKDAIQLFKTWRKDLSRYGQTNTLESYAEAFAQWVLGGPGSSPVADAYARRYGWK